MARGGGPHFHGLSGVWGKGSATTGEVSSPLLTGIQNPAAELSEFPLDLSKNSGKLMPYIINLRS